MLLYVYTGATQMNVIDEKFYGLMKEISGLSEKERDVLRAQKCRETLQKSAE